MKNKFFIIGLVLFLAIGLVNAAQGEFMDGEKPALYGSENEVIDDPGLPGEGIVENGSAYVKGSREGQRMTLGEGAFEIEDGKQLRVKEGEMGLRLEADGKYAECEDCELEQVMVQGRMQIQAKLSNGRNSEIKIMPSTASLRAIERLQLKNCPVETCTIELKEVGKDNETKMAYEIKAKKRAKFLGIFGTEMDVEAQVDAETGEVLNTKRPWWSFMASEKDETIEQPAA